MEYAHHYHFTTVAVNRENDTCFENGLVMGSAGYSHYAGLVKTPKSCFKRKLGPLPALKEKSGAEMAPGWSRFHVHRMAPI